MTNESNQQRSESRQQSIPDVPLNYFGYFTEVEDAFIRRRGKHLHLSSLDWQLIEIWKDRGVPLHVVLSGIERWFDFYETKRKRRSVNTLAYCQEEIEAQYEEWLEARVGGVSEPSAITTENDGLPFPRQNILDHLRRGQEALEQARTQSGRDDGLTEAISRAINLLAELQHDFATTARPNARQLEDSLTSLERMLSDSLLQVVPHEKLAEAKKQVKEQLRPYRSHMEKAAYQQTFDNLLLKRLREEAGLPRLSLFYL